MKKIIYCKYNQNRSPKFQTKTVIYQTDERKYIEKEALCKEAAGHISMFQKNYRKVKDIYPEIEFIPCELEDGRVRYPFIKGKSMDEYLKENVSDWEALFSEINRLIEKLYKVNPEKRCQFELTEDFQERFGNVDCKGDACIQPCNLDVIFDNLMIMENGTVKAFDYEWVCDFPVPEKYILYRVLCRFYDKYFGYISQKYSFEQYINQFDFNKEEQKRYRQMEDAFIQYIYKGGEPAFQAEQYFLKRNTFEDISNMQNNYKGMEEGLEHAVEDYKEVIEVLHKTEKEYLETIDRLNQAVEIKEEVEALLHKTEKEYLETIGKLNNTEKMYSDTQKMYSDVQKKCSDTEKMYLDTAEQLGIVSQERENLCNQLELIKNSFSWKMTRPLRGIKKGVRSVKQDGIRTTIKRVEKRLGNSSGEEENKQTEAPENEKNKFLQELEVCESALEQQRNQRFHKECKISIITPLFNTPKEFLIDLIESVKKQTYTNWEFCLVNFSDTAFEEVDRICREYAQKDLRIAYYVENENKGISENTNICIQHATGDYIALLDHDDVLHPCALYEAVKAINETGCDFLYTDEIKFEEDLTNVFLPNYKPDFSKDELRAHNYICHFNVYAKSLYDKAGGYRKAFDGSQDHDIVLRLTEKANKIVHIPKILYYWRVHSNSVAQSIEAKSYATDAGALAVTDQLKRCGEKQYAESVINHIPLYRIHPEEMINGSLTIALWDVKSLEEAKRTILSLKESQDINYHFIAVEGADGCANSQEEFKKAGICLLKRVEKQESTLWNEAMEKTSDQHVLWIKAGMEVITDHIADELLIYKKRKDIAAIDTKVLSTDHTIFSGGLFVDPEQKNRLRLRCCGSVEDYCGYENGLLHTRNVVAAAGICTLVFREVWQKLGGFQPTNGLPVLSYSYQGFKKGYGNLWIPFIQVKGNTEGLKNIYEQEIEIEESTDPYLSERVIRLGLE